ncbi:MAG: ABC transporter substrate-binding protein [Tepidisphaeraceae bacterium]
MSRLALTMACLDYDRVKPLMTRAIEPQGIDLNILTYPADYSVWPMIRHQEFDVSEMTLASYAVLHSRGEAAFVGIPVFLARTFTHAGLFVNTRSGIREPRDLHGKRVGSGQYLMTFAAWMRGILQNEYGVDLSKIEWRTGRPEAELSLPAQMKVSLLPEGKMLPDRLEDGEIDALIAPRIPDKFRAHEFVKPMFPDSREVELQYFRKTGVFPILHLVVIKESIYREHPWVASSLMRAFTQARDACYRDLSETLEGVRYTLPWLDSHVSEVRKQLGPDFWPYGLKRNRATLETYVRYLHQQHFLKHEIPVEQLFAANALEA